MDEWTSFAGKFQQGLRRIFVGRRPKKKCGKSHSSVIFPQLFLFLHLSDDIHGHSGGTEELIVLIFNRHVLHYRGFSLV